MIDKSHNIDDIDPQVLTAALPNWKAGQYTGVSIFGIDLSNDPLQRAMQSAQINKLYGYSTTRSYGVIGLVKVKVFGT